MREINLKEKQNIAINMLKELKKITEQMETDTKLSVEINDIKKKILKQ